MKIVTYMLKNFFPVFIGALLFFILVLCLTDLFMNLWNYISKGVSSKDVGLIILYYVPKTVWYAVPIAMLFATAYMLSDFYAKHNFSDAITICNRKHDLVAIQVYDRLALELPDVGLIRVVDAETDEEMYVDTGSRKMRQLYRQYWTSRQARLMDMLTKSNVDNVSISTDDDFVKKLLLLFKRRN